MTDSEKKKLRAERLLLSHTPHLELVQQGLEDAKAATEKGDMQKAAMYTRDTIRALLSHVIDLERRLSIAEKQLTPDDGPAPGLPE